MVIELTIDEIEKMTTVQLGERAAAIAARLEAAMDLRQRRSEAAYLRVVSQRERLHEIIARRGGGT